MTSQTQTGRFLFSGVILDVIDREGVDMTICSQFIGYFEQQKFYLTSQTWVRVLQSICIISRGSRLFASTRSLNQADIDHIVGVCEFLGERSILVSSKAWWELLAFQNAVKGSKYSDPQQPFRNLESLLTAPDEGDGIFTRDELEEMVKFTATKQVEESKPWYGLEFLNPILSVEGWTVLVSLVGRLERESISNQEALILFKVVYNSRSKLENVALLDKSTLELLLESKSPNTCSARRNEIMDRLEEMSIDLLNLFFQSCSIEPPLLAQVED